MRYKGFREYLILNEISLKEYEERLNEQMALYQWGDDKFGNEINTPADGSEDDLMDSMRYAMQRVSAIDDVKSPKHYKLEGLELEGKDIIKSVLGKEGYKSWCHGTALKYLFRAGKKEDELKDFKKARVYLDWIIEEMEE